LASGRVARRSTLAIARLARWHRPNALRISAPPIAQAAFRFRPSSACPADAVPVSVVALKTAARALGARASSAQIVVVDGAVLRLAVRDDGVGGARTDGSSRLLGLHDRAAALNGELHVESPPGEGTVIAATIPIPAL
jgi:hypothetical protein